MRSLRPLPSFLRRAARATLMGELQRPRLARRPAMPCRRAKVADHNSIPPRPAAPATTHLDSAQDSCQRCRGGSA